MQLRNSANPSFLPHTEANEGNEDDFSKFEAFCHAPSHFVSFVCFCSKLRAHDYFPALAASCATKAAWAGSCRLVWSTSRTLAELSLNSASTASANPGKCGLRR